MNNVSILLRLFMRLSNFALSPYCDMVKLHFPTGSRTPSFYFQISEPLTTMEPVQSNFAGRSGNISSDSDLLTQTLNGTAHKTSRRGEIPGRRPLGKRSLRSVPAVRAELGYHVQEPCRWTLYGKSCDVCGVLSDALTFLEPDFSIAVSLLSRAYPGHFHNTNDWGGGALPWQNIETQNIE